MRRAERLVHVGVVTPDQALHEGRVVRLLAPVETQVLGELHARAQRLETLAHGVHLPPRVTVPRRAPEMRGGRDLGPLLEQPIQRGQRGGDAEVVGDGRPAAHTDVERDVEVDAHEDPAPVDRLDREVLEGGDARQSAGAPVRRAHRRQLPAPTSTARSTSRFE